MVGTSRRAIDLIQKRTVLRCTGLVVRHPGHFPISPTRKAGTSVDVQQSILFWPECECGDCTISSVAVAVCSFSKTSIVTSPLAYSRLPVVNRPKTWSSPGSLIRSVNRPRIGPRPGPICRYGPMIAISLRIGPICFLHSR